ncbi:MAG: hypothetical protein ACE5EA_10285, partial [Nitrospirota bacterium]
FFINLFGGMKKMKIVDYKTKIFVLFMTCLSLFLIAGCGDSGGGGDGDSKPVISLSASTLNFTAEVGGTNPQDQTVTMSNSGGGLLQYTASTETAWLDGYSVDNSSNNATITVIVDITGLSAGSYTGTITISAPEAASKTITVNLTVTDGSSNPVISLSTSTLSFTAEVGGTNPQDQTVTVSNGGEGLLVWTPSTETAWISGFINNNSTNETTLTVSVDITGLSAGSYTGTITISASEAASKTITVSLTVTETTAQQSITLSGIVTYTYYKADQTGIVYSNPLEKPIRGAVVELYNSIGVVLESGNTTETGQYSFTAPANSNVSVVVTAALGDPDTPRVKIVDNTNNSALYGIYLDISTGIEDIVQDFNADSGWDGLSYSGTRAAAPFAILDTIYQAEQLIKSADPNVTFPSLAVNWSENNKPSEGDVANGDIESSSYDSDTGNLYILGAEDLDTDEYDSHVIAHEWSHYFEDKLSRSDNIGGDHTGGDILDPRVAFGEGWGNAFSGMVFNDPLYIDTSGFFQLTVTLMDLDTDSVSDSDQHVLGILLDGFYSESSIQEILYDLFDSGPSDDDNISLGFKPIYDVMVGGQKNTPAYTSIFSFLKYLKDGNSSISADITSLAAAENISTGDEYEASDQPLYTGIPVDGTIVNTDVDGFPLQTWETYGVITANDPGNKLFNRMFFGFSIPSSGNYTIEVVPINGGDVFFELNETGNKTNVDDYIAGVTESLTKSLSAGDYVMTVGSLGGEAAFTIRIY